MSKRIFYRYAEYLSVDGIVSIHLQEFRVIKETKQGVVLQMPYSLKTKRVLLEWSSGCPTHKRWAWETKEEALSSYIRRKERHLGILNTQKMMAEAGLEIAKSGDLNKYVKVVDIFNLERRSET